METVIIENRDEEKSITHPQYGPFRYYEIAGEPWLMRRDVSIGFGLSGSSSCSAFITDKCSKVAVRKFVKSANMTTVIINKDGLKEFMQYGVKNRGRRQLVGHWLLKELYGEQANERQEDLFKAAPAPVTLSPAQMQELVRRVTVMLKAEPLKIALSDKEKAEIVSEAVEDVTHLLQAKPITLSEKQMDELTRRVTVMLKAEPLEISLPTEEQEKFVDDVAAKFENRPINLTDKQMDDIAFKVLALIEDMKPDEDALAERVLEKFLGKIAQKK